MFPENEFAYTYMRTLWTRIQVLRDDDRGMSTEAAVLTAALIGIALGLTVYIGNRVTREGERIEGGG
jgi:hypothetical protein